MKRRTLVTSLAAAGGSALVVSCGSKGSESGGQAADGRDSDMPRVRWRMATSWPQSLDTVFGGAETICQRVAELSAGRFQITAYAAGEIAPGLEVLETVQKGAVHCGHTASYYYIGKNPALAFGSTVPFGLTAQQQNAWLYHGGGLEAINKLYADFGVVSFPAGSTGAQMGGWFKRKVVSLADLKGLKMRIPGLGAKVMAELGVNVQVLPGGEIYLALERGAIDAAEWTGPYDDEKLGLAKAAPYYYYPGWWEPGLTLTALVNQQAWQKLTKPYKAMFQTACWEANLNTLSRYDTQNGAALKALVAGGTELVPYSEEIMSKAKRIAFELYNDSAAKDTGFRLIFDQWQSFRRDIYNWNRINELPFASFSFSKGNPSIAAASLDG